MTKATYLKKPKHLIFRTEGVYIYIYVNIQLVIQRTSQNPLERCTHDTSTVTIIRTAPMITYKLAFNILFIF